MLQREVRRRLHEYAGDPWRWVVLVADGRVMVGGQFRSEVDEDHVRVLATSVAGIKDVVVGSERGHRFDCW
jgi:osmotically-inducible protein OsmY